MPDHLHWLFALGEKAPLQQTIASMKRRSAYRINEQNSRTGTPVWQPGFHDYALRKEEVIKDVARYIVANPLRAGLVKKIGDYPLWDAVWL
jgi:REP element-mobilizing transposase RayT